MNLPKLFQSLVILFLPLYILRFNFLIPTTFLEIILILAVFVTIIDFIKNRLPWKKLQTKFDVYILIFLISAIIALFKSYDFYGGLGILKAYFLEPIIFFYCLIYTARKIGYNYIINSLIISAFWLSILGIIQKITGSFSLAPYEIVQKRIPALYNSANSFALYLGPIALLVFGRFLEQSKREKKILYLILFLFLTVMMLWTKSRGGLFSELGALIIFTYIILALKVSVLKRIWCVIPTIAFLLIGIFFYLFYQNYNFLPESYGEPYTQGDTLQIRYFIWIGTTNLLQDHFIFGAGLNGFKTLYSNQYRLTQFQEQFQYPHNLILTFWTETGIFGLFAFLLLLVNSLSLVIRNITKSQYKVMGAILIGMLSYVLLHGIVDVPYFKNDLSLQFFIIIALIQLWKDFSNSSNVHKSTLENN